MSRLPYVLDPPVAARDTLGLIVLQVDQVVERDFRRLFAPELALHVSRVPSGADLNPGTIAAMEHELPRAANLLPPAATFGAVGYACTSGAALIGPPRVAELVASAARTGAVTDPLTAAFAALAALGARSVALVSPYVDSVAAPVRRAFETAGYAMPATLSFGEEAEARVARIAPAALRAAARGAAASGADAVFLSCTNLRTLDVIDDLEAELGCPVLSSNLVLAWHMAMLSGAPLSESAPGQLSRRRP